MVLSTEDVKNYLDSVEKDFPHDECRTCECFLGYLVQLELDSSSEARFLLGSYKPSRGQVHACLGCDPCSPADHYLDYLQRKQKGREDPLRINLL